MNYTALKNKTYFLTKTNSTSFPDADLVAEINNAFDRVTSLILTADGKWQWDDSNQTDYPEATHTITSGQQDYVLNASHLRILSVKVKDSSGNWRLLKTLDQKDETEPLEQLFTANGIPEYYNKVSNSIFLYPTPDYTQAASLKLEFQRGPSYFTTSDTTKEPGFNSLYHDLLPLWAAYNYGLVHGLANTNQLFAEIERREKSLVEEYAMRNKDEKAMFINKLNEWR